MKTIKQSTKEMIEVIKNTGLLREDVSDIEINRLLDELEVRETYEYVSPINAFFLSNLESLYVSEFDDCNLYQEPNYYVKILEEITKFSCGDISFSEISESWIESGDVILTFSVNNIPSELEFNTQEESDVVPGEFIVFVHKSLMDYKGNSRYLSTQGVNGENIYFRLETSIAEKVDNILKTYKSPHE